MFSMTALALYFYIYIGHLKISMVWQWLLHHHFVKRQQKIKHRVKQKIKPNSRIKLIDKLIMFIAPLGPLTHIPQIMKIYIEKNAAGVSLVSWIAFTILIIPWFFYGVVHRQKPIVLSSTLLFLFDLSIVIGILLYQ